MLTPATPADGPAVQGRLRLRERPRQPLRRVEGRAAGRRLADRRASWAPSPAAARRRASTWAPSCGPTTWTCRSWRCRAPRATYANDLAALKAARRRPGARAARAAAQHDRARRPDVELARPATGPGSARATSTRSDGSCSPHNHGGLFAALWVPDAEAAPGADPDGWWAEGMLHELSHNLGAVGDSAPHSSGYGHCCDGYDVMCYRDDPAAPRDDLPVPADPGRDEPGLRLRRRRLLQRRPGRRHLPGDHWNLYDNRFLAACAERRARPAAAPRCPRPTRSRRSPRPSRRSPATRASARCSTALAGALDERAVCLPVPVGAGRRHDLAGRARRDAARPTPSAEDDVDLRLRVRVIAVNARRRHRRLLPADRHRRRPAGGGRRDALADPGRGAQPRPRGAADHARARPRQAPRDDRLPDRGRPPARRRHPRAARPRPLPAAPVHHRAAGRAARAAR